MKSRLTTNEFLDTIELLNKLLKGKPDFTIQVVDMMEQLGYESRICTTCGEIMVEGYCIEGGDAYYCSDECMTKDGMTIEEFEELYNNGEGDSYWTEWF